ncbi:acetylxylan esterase [Ruficoccus amylovorans]|uniref:Acetylxylan esterase n=1 Tax=Ruficoccus amylovorans TaxID=1804625 RepID=A0A842HJQ5_9BACT|nr:acetylxylan esterase [Ruficoccus amylovorans]
MRDKCESLRAAFTRPSYQTPGKAHGLRKLVPVGADALRWETTLRPALLAQWRERLGHPALGSAGDLGQARPLAECETMEFRGVLWSQKTGPSQEQRVLILHPRESSEESTPCAVVPYYNVERPAGLCVDPRRGTALVPDAGLPEVAPLGLHLVRQGLTVACVEAFPFNTVPEPDAAELEADDFAWWRAGAAHLLREHPAWTGLGRLVRDTSLAVGLLLEQPGVDTSRVLAMGHSLGGKMAFFTGALDPRITAVIGSDFGLPWRSTNWNDPWYLGRAVPEDDQGAALHEVLALLAPRPFFLVAGETDGRESWQYIQAAQEVYSLLGVGTDGLPGAIDHASGHAPSLAALEVAYAWLREHFRLGWKSWRR